MRKPIVIIGYSATAVGAIESIRRHDQTIGVVAISDERHDIYSRPLLSHYLAGEIDDARLNYRRPGFARRHHVEQILDDRVMAIDPEAHTVTTASGNSYAYSKLLLATGGVPIVPPIPGLDTEGVYTFTKLDDALHMLGYLRTETVQRVIVVGGGMIGIKAADALLKRGLHITMVELAPRILGAGFDETASRMMTGLLLDAGVEVLTGNTVVSVASRKMGDGCQSRVTQVTLREGGEIACDMLVLGIGVRPNASLAVDAGIKVGRGIVVDEYMRTSAQDIYAAGDVAEAYDMVVDMHRTVAIWPNAYRQGAIAGAHMVGVSRPDAGGIAMNAIEVCGVSAMSIGDATPQIDEQGADDRYEILSDSDERACTYKRLVLRGDRLVGAILIGNVNRAGIYTGLIRNKIDVSSLRNRLMSDHFGLLSLPDQYRKHVVTGEGIEV